MDEQIPNATYIDKAVYCNNCKRIAEVPEGVNIEVMQFGGTEHHKATCKKCGSYIKFLGQTKNIDTMPFGKYKGLSFMDIGRRDRGYLAWLLSAERIPENLKKAAETAWLLLKEESK